MTHLAIAGFGWLDRFCDSSGSRDRFGEIGGPTELLEYMERSSRTTIIVEEVQIIKWLY
jgi:hypothetical protein